MYVYARSTKLNYVFSQIRPMEMLKYPLIRFINTEVA